jgi:membrane protein DedA with SNARE-associated domain
MITQFLHYLETAFVTTNPSGLIILFSLAVITDIGIPAPFLLDTVLMLTAYKVWMNPDPNWMPVILIVLMLFVGRQVGSGVLYWMSRYFGYAFLKRIKKYFPSVGNGLDTFEQRLHHWAPLVVVTGRLTPGLLQVTSVASGAIRLRYDFFAIGIAVASLIYDGVLVFLGFIAAHNPRANDIDFTFWILIAMIVIVCILWPVIFTVIKHNKKKVEVEKS